MCWSLHVAADGEDVVYAVSAQDAKAEMGPPCKGGGDNCFLFTDQEEATEVGAGC